MAFLEYTRPQRLKKKVFKNVRNIETPRQLGDKNQPYNCVKFFERPFSLIPSSTA